MQQFLLALLLASAFAADSALEVAVQRSRDFVTACTAGRLGDYQAENLDFKQRWTGTRSIGFIESPATITD